jgi:hypothetical protein
VTNIPKYLSAMLAFALWEGIALTSRWSRTTRQRFASL